MMDEVEVFVTCAVIFRHESTSCSTWRWLWQVPAIEETHDTTTFLYDIAFIRLDLAYPHTPFFFYSETTL